MSRAKTRPIICEVCEEECDSLESSEYTAETPNYARVCLFSAEQVKERSFLPSGGPVAGPRRWLPGQAPKPHEYRAKRLCEGCKARDDGENAEPLDLPDYD